MRNIIIIAFIALLGSCATPNLYNTINYGRYNVSTDFYNGDLTIKKDNSFEYSRRIPHRNNTCKGYWEVLSKKEMLINGKDIMSYEGVDSIFFERLDCLNDTIEFISRNKLRYKDLVFKKVSK